MKKYYTVCPLCGHKAPLDKKMMDEQIQCITGRCYYVNEDGELEPKEIIEDVTSFSTFCYKCERYIEVSLIDCIIAEETDEIKYNKPNIIKVAEYSYDALGEFSNLLNEKEIDYDWYDENIISIPLEEDIKPIIKEIFDMGDKELAYVYEHADYIHVYRA